MCMRLSSRSALAHELQSGLADASPETNMLQPPQRRVGRGAMLLEVRLSARILETSELDLGACAMALPDLISRLRQSMRSFQRDLLLVLASAVPASSLLVVAAPSPRRAAVPLRSAAPLVASAIPTTATLAVACTVPTCLGFWKTEYGVSYAYGAAMAAAGLMHVGASSSPLATAHALCLVAYGVRLNVFLLFRELFITRFREFREKVEARAVAKGSRLVRAPFVISCSLLYFCMAAPLRLTASFAPKAGSASAAGLAALVALQAIGWFVAALGDLTKSWVKAERGEDHLVTSGIFGLLRHPNYTGEALLWSANGAAGALVLVGAPLPLLAKVGWLAASLVGVLGILFVLMSATGNLEAKQAEKHGGAEDYARWLATSWKGPALTPKPKTPPVEEPAEEEGASGGVESS